MSYFFDRAYFLWPRNDSKWRTALREAIIHAPSNALVFENLVLERLESTAAQTFLELKTYFKQRAQNYKELSQRRRREFAEIKTTILTSAAHSGLFARAWGFGRCLFALFVQSEAPFLFSLCVDLIVKGILGFSLFLLFLVAGIPVLGTVLVVV